MVSFIIRLILALFIIGFTLISCKNTSAEKKIKTEEITFKKEGELSINRNDSIISKIDIEIADNEYEHQTGLMYRTSMKENQGMLFVFEDEEPRYFYMKNTEIPLDIFYIDSNFKVVSIVKNAQPMNDTSLPSNFPAKYVLELNAGMANSWNLKEGDSISYKKI